MEKVNEDIISGISNFLDPQRKKITQYLTTLGIFDYEITKDYTVNVNHNVMISNKTIEECPVVFETVKGNFIWHYTNLKTLKNMPKRVTGNFIVANNKLTSLKGAPITVDGNFICSNNKLKDLTGGPTSVGGYICNNCELESLNGAPEVVRVDFMCNNNNLTDLRYGPKRVYGLFDCSNNKLTTMANMPLSFKLNNSDNPLEKDTNLPLIIKDFEINDEVVYDKPGSKWDGYEGTITSIDPESPEKPEKTYFIKFSSVKNKLEKDATIINISGQYIKKKGETDTPKTSVSPVEELHEGEYVSYDRFPGIIKSIDENGVCDIKFDKYTGLYKLHASNVKRSIKPVEMETASSGTTTPEQKTRDWKYGVCLKCGNFVYPTYSNYCTKCGTLIGEKPKDLPPLKKGDKIRYNKPKAQWDGYIGFVYDTSTFTPGYEVEDRTPGILYDIRLLDKDGKFVRLLTNIRREDLIRLKEESPITITPKDTTETKKEELFKAGDKIVYLDPDGELDNCVGTITLVTPINNVPFYNISIKDKKGAFVYKHDVTQKNLEKLIEKIKKVVRDEIPKKMKFYVGQKIKYIGNRKDYSGRELENLEGTVNFLNVNTSSVDLRLKKDNLESLLYNVDPDYVIPLTKVDFEKGNKVIYDNANDAQLNKKVGIIVKKNKAGRYNVTFNTSDSIITITDADPYNFKRYVPTDVDFSVEDDIIFTKPDSKNYGCKGTIISYDIESDTYELQITSRDNKKVKVKGTKIENIEKQPPKKQFKVGDKIRFVNPSHYQNGGIGEVVKKTQTGKYEIRIKSPKYNSIVSIDADPDNLVLLEECDESEKFVFGQKVIYKNPASKWNNQIGEFQGIRQKDGKLEVKFDSSTNQTVRVYLDDAEGKFLEAHGATKTVYTSTDYTANRKKKKKDKEPPLKPVLVYNRRYVAGAKGRKPGDPEPVIDTKKVDKEAGLEIGDKVTILNSATSMIIGKTGEIKKLPVHMGGRYEVSVNRIIYFLAGDQFEKIEEPKEESKSEEPKSEKPKEESKFKLGDKVVILDVSYDRHIIGKVGEIRSSEPNQWGRYNVVVGGISYYMAENQFKKVEEEPKKEVETSEKKSLDLLKGDKIKVIKLAKPGESGSQYKELLGKEGAFIEYYRRPGGETLYCALINADGEQRKYYLNGDQIEKVENE